MNGLSKEQDPQGVRQQLFAAAKALVGWLALVATFGGSLVLSFLGAHWLDVGLGGALLITTYTLFRREVARQGAGGIVGGYGRREDLDRRTVLKELRTAKAIDMIGYNLRNPWLRPKGEFDDIVRGRLKTEKDFRIRIIIADPDSEGLKRRELQEDGLQSGRMEAAGQAALMYLNLLLREQGAGQVEVRLVDGDFIRDSQVIANDVAFVTIYLATRTGNNCPGMVVRGRSSAVLSVLREEFATLWEKHATVHTPPP